MHKAVLPSIIAYYFVQNYTFGKQVTVQRGEEVNLRVNFLWKYKS